MTFLVPRYDPWVVGLSVLIASFASFVAFDLARRVRSRDRIAARRWWFFGSAAMGTGVWSMHFVGMQAFSLPIALGYSPGLTAASWVAAVAVSGAALAIASQGAINWRRLSGGSVAMGAGICAMHYTGMAAIDLDPAISWDVPIVAASAVLAIASAAGALVIFSWLRRRHARRGALHQAAAALVMGVAISGMHYTGMAAARFPAGAVCLSSGGIGGSSLVTLVVVASMSLLAMTLFTSIVDRRMQSRANLLATSLQIANAQLQAANEELRKRAFLDPLTDLPNRALFEERLGRAVARSDASAPAVDRRERLAVLFIDLDGFKPVNDSYGHATGDVVLLETARRLRTQVRDGDTLARVGGDEFLLLLDRIGDGDAARVRASHLLQELGRPFEIGGREIQVSGSIGIVLYPDDGDKNKLVARADAAMYAAKRNGGNAAMRFESHMDGGALEQLSLQNELRHALERGEFELHYQPKLTGRQGEVHGVEALLRWLHPQRGSVSPEIFVPIAERLGLMNEIGDWVIDEACRQIAAWRARGLVLRVAVNVSVHQLRRDDLAYRIGRTLARHRVDASQLLCEITESVAMEDVKATQRAFEALRRMGIFLSIDDFGTGYSSLSTLRQLPAQELKIDRSFVRDLASSSDARAIVDAVVRLAHALGLRVVAEGVENEAQRDILLRLGCDELQGYLFARPMRPGDLARWIEEAPGSASAHAAERNEPALAA